MSAEVLSIEVTAELRDFKKRMKEIPGVTKTEATDAVNGILRQLKRAEKGAADSAKKVSDEWDRSWGTIGRTAERGLGKLGGVFGAVGDAVFDFVGPLTGAAGVLGTIGVVAGAAAIGLAAAAGGGLLVVGAMNALVSAGAAAEERLEAVGLAAVLPADARASLDGYTDSTGLLRNEWDRLIALNASIWADELTTNVSFLTDAIAFAGDATEFLSTDVAGFIRSVHEGVPIVGDFVAELYAWRDGVIAARVETVRNQAALDDLQKAVASFGKIREEVAKAEEKRQNEADAAARKAQAEAKRKEAEAAAELRAIEAIADAHEELRRITSDANDDQRTDAGKLIEAHRREVDAILEKGKAAEDVAATDEAIAATDMRLLRDLTRLRTDAEKQRREDAKETADFLETIEAKQRQNTRDLALWTLDQWRNGVWVKLEEDQQAVLDEMVSGMDQMAAKFRGIIDGPIGNAFNAFADFASEAVDFILEKLDEQIEALQEAAEEQVEIATEAAEQTSDIAETAAESELDAQNMLIDQQLAKGEITAEEARQAKLQAQRDHNDELIRIGQQYEAEFAAAQAMDADERGRALKAFRRSQALQRAAAVVEGVRAGIALIPSFAALPFGAGVAAAAIIAGTATGFAIDRINSQKPPEFPSGFTPPSPDHELVGKQPQEGIANRRAMETPGFASVLERANRGERSRSSSSVGVTVGLDRRTGKLKVATDKRAGKRGRRRH